MFWDGDCIGDLGVRVVVCPGIGGDQHSARFAALVYRVQGLSGQWRQGQQMSTRSLVLPFSTPSSSGRVFCFSIKFGRVTSLACLQGWRLRGEVVAKCAARSKRPFWRYESDTHSFVRRWLARNKRCNRVTSRVFSVGFSFFCKSSYEICLFWLTMYEWKERCGRSSWSTFNFKNYLIWVGLICLYFLYFSRFVRGSRRLVSCTIVPAKVLVLVAVGTCHHIEVC